MALLKKMDLPFPQKKANGEEANEAVLIEAEPEKLEDDAERGIKDEGAEVNGDEEDEDDESEFNGLDD